MPGNPFLPNALLGPSDSSSALPQAQDALLSLLTSFFGTKKKLSGNSGHAVDPLLGRRRNQFKILRDEPVPGARFLRCWILHNPLLRAPRVALDTSLGAAATSSPPCCWKMIPNLNFSGNFSQPHSPLPRRKGILSFFSKDCSSTRGLMS